MFQQISINRAEKIEKIKQNIKILMVDDEKPAIFEYLDARKYNIYYKSDMTYPIEAEPFDIILLDIKGVASERGSSMEGFALAAEIKKEYPLKKVLVYSGSSFHKEVTNRKDEVDGIIPRDEDPDRFCDVIDKNINNYTDYEKQWDIIRQVLKENKLSEKQIDGMRKKYIKIFEKNDTRGTLAFDKELNTYVKDATTVLNIISSVITLMKVLIV